MNLLEQVLSRENMTRAYHRVMRNGGASGIDKMETSELKSHLATAWESIKTRIVEGSYTPQAVRGVWIDKAGGGKR